MERGAGPGSPPTVRRLRRLERICFGVATALLVFFAGARVHSAVSRQLELASFDRAKAALAGSATEIPLDQSLWAEGRIAKYEESLHLTFAPPLAVLRIPRLGIVVPVLPGIDELTLNRAVGAIPGTAVPGEPGNVGIAGHRDGFFRGLKDIAAGDRLELETLTGRQEYQVTSIRIVDPAAVEVLAPTAQPAVTLVTCYPFYFVGKAPQRFIVRAEALSPAREGEGRQNR
jgi:sortase A